MNGRLELRIITHLYSEVYWGYFGRLVFGNSLTKHNNIISFSYSVVIFVIPLSRTPPCYHTKPPDFPRLIGPRVIAHIIPSVALVRLVRLGCTGQDLTVSTGPEECQGTPNIRMQPVSFSILSTKYPPPPYYPHIKL